MPDRLAVFVRAQVVLVAEVLFLLILAVADIAAPRIGTISDGVHGPFPWLVTAAFVLHILSLAGLSMMLRGIPAAAVGVSAIGMALLTVFPTSDGWVQAVHVTGATLAFGGLAVGAATLARLRALGWLVVFGTLAMALSLVVGGFPVMERVQVLLNGAWILAAAWPWAFSTPPKSPAP